MASTGLSRSPGDATDGGEGAHRIGVRMGGGAPPATDSRGEGLLGLGD